ncbi:uncharacterized protein LOC143197342 isoform X2 [Rhynchophorus ferrugineus]|uniref:uncharacterized protein LOC143197342 isoform X2 n=1 Tax=Rhynchophorus ferrugineus TaxID=354439 RepID=UPI003FCED637
MSESLNGQNVELEDRRQRTRTDSATQTPPAIVLSALADNGSYVSSSTHHASSLTATVLHDGLDINHHVIYATDWHRTGIELRLIADNLRSTMVSR